MQKFFIMPDCFNMELIMRFKNVQENIRRVLISGIILSLFSLTACGGGGGGGGGGDDDEGSIIYDPVNNSYARTFAGGTAENISGFNSKPAIYALITYLPSNKSESDYPAGTTSAWTFTTKNSSSLSIESSDAVKYSTESDSLISSEKQGLNSKQAECDLKMRANDNKALAGKEPQLSKKMSMMYSKAPSTIAVGSTWNGVTIAITNKTIATTCKYVSAHAYIFVDNRDSIDGLVAGYGAVFDAIYDKNHAKFGTENDVDGNGKVIIVFSQEVKTGKALGYFNPVDKYSASTYSDSNEGDIFYITTDGCGGTADQENIIKATLAHEFQHMIYFDEHYNRGVTATYAWLNEALSQAAEYYNNYLVNHEGWMKNFLCGNASVNWADLSLTHWTSYNYGYGAIYIRYLIEQYGDTAIKNMCSTEKVGIAAVEAATGDDFNSIFYNFTIALAISDTVASTDTDYNSKYDFTILKMQDIQQGGAGVRKGLVPTSTVLSAGGTVTGSNRPYEIYFIKGSGSFGTMSVTGKNIVGTAFGLSQ